MSPATIVATKSALAYTEQTAPVPKSASENVPVTQALWIIPILAFILWVLLAWKAFDEREDPDRDDGKISRLPPY
jgi:heme/copper-type cytochrome/quinol oxidase subunit 2